MGNRIMGPGQSASATKVKEGFFGLCLGYHMKREAQFLSRLKTLRPYFHLDLNAGAGFNDLSRTVGTPNLFMRRALNWRGLPIEAAFIESNPKSVAALRGRLLEFGAAFNGDLFGLERRFDIVQGDNEKYLSRFVERVSIHDRPQHARGSIISDPNGWARYGGAVDLRTLSAVLAALPNFMVLQFFPYSLGAMVTGWQSKDPARKATLRNVDDFLPMRRHWLISQPSEGKICLCGSAGRYPEGPNAFALDSAVGREIRRRCGGNPDADWWKGVA